MAIYNYTSLAFAVEQAECDCFEEVEVYLSSDDGYWISNDIWKISSGKFAEHGISQDKATTDVIADFSTINDYKLKTELKYHALWSLSTKTIAVSTYAVNYKTAIIDIGEIINERANVRSITQIELTNDDFVGKRWASFRKNTILFILNRTKALLADIYDIKDETEKDVWRALRIPGARLSAVQKRNKPSLHFSEIPDFYKETVKRYFRRLVIKRSWSHCSEMLRYIKAFFRLFYDNGYDDGFLKDLNRQDIEKYLEWAANEHKGNNATYASKAVSFIREFLDYIQMAEYQEAPEKDIYRLIFDDDVPKRERQADTFEKIKYIPEPVRIQLDANVSDIKPEKMQPVYILLRETGWRGTDILNLRYDTCIDHVWNKDEEKYIPYLCGEITKTGIPVLKIPIRDDVAEMLGELKKEAETKSTEANNPDRYLFNTYEGVNIGLPYRKADFVGAVQDMIDRKGIQDADGKPYHFKTHSLRHTRASEYAEQGMPIGVIRHMLGHCSLQMSLHYARVSENAVYEKWKETDELGILHIERDVPDNKPATSEKAEVLYQDVRKGLDAVRVPFGVCFKPSKLTCKTQMEHCLNCASFCSTKENEAEYREEIKRVGALIALGKQYGRQEWVDKNQEYLDLLMRMVERIRQEGIVHKNGDLREEAHA